MVLTLNCLARLFWPVVCPECRDRSLAYESRVMFDGWVCVACDRGRRYRTAAANFPNDDRDRSVRFSDWF